MPKPDLVSLKAPGILLCILLLIRGMGLCKTVGVFKVTTRMGLFGGPGLRFQQVWYVYGALGVEKIASISSCACGGSTGKK